MKDAWKQMRKDWYKARINDLSQLLSKLPSAKGLTARATIQLITQYRELNREINEYTTGLKRL